MWVGGSNTIWGRFGRPGLSRFFRVQTHLSSSPRKNDIKFLPCFGGGSVYEYRCSSSFGVRNICKKKAENPGTEKEQMRRICSRSRTIFFFMYVCVSGLILYVSIRTL